ncbi:DUF1444 family protein [Chitinophaga agrisoli]|uniref:DUF1444 family protein n=1 Tax=Chitinophaga agrisoli TaxID=2607653 RepID=A0A5B2VLV4_9BACT|nr:DUF1444 family protein [Chitinophaga agrisoli]KAA2239476.1 DUF1444 family protein [Chitinophaga agrisoli]
MSFLSSLFGGNKPADKQQVLTKAEFAQFYMAALENEYPQASFTLQPDLTIHSNYGGTEGNHYIDNAFMAYEGEPGQLQEIINRYLAACAHLYQEEDTLLLENVVPVIKAGDFGEGLTTGGDQAGEISLVKEQYNDDLVIAYAEDKEHALAYLTQGRLADCQISLESLREIALGYLENLLPNIERHGDNGLYMVTAGGTFEASLILLPSIWTQENFPVDGEFVIIIPNRDLLFITGSNSPEHIAKMKDMAEESYHNGNYPVSPFLFKWNGERFERFDA